MKFIPPVTAAGLALRVDRSVLALVGICALAGCAAPGPASYAPARTVNSDSTVAQAQRDAQDRQVNEQQRQAYLANQQYQRDLQARQAREQQQNAAQSSNPVDQIADKVRAEQQKAENAGMLTPSN